MHRAVLEKKVNEATDIVSFWFRPEKMISHVAGQFIEMYLPHDHPDDRGIKRWFTLSCSPTDSPLISITTKFSEKSSTFKTTLKALKVGDKVQISEPMGDFVLPKDKTIPLLFVAGGMGITPFHSIIKFLSDTGEKRDIQLLYSVRVKEDLIFQPLLEAYPLKKYLPLVSQPDAAWHGETGQLDGKRILKLANHIDTGLIYVSGPEPMVEAFEKQLEELGVPHNQFVGDYFPGYPAP